MHLGRAPGGLATVGPGRPGEDLGLGPKCRGTPLKTVEDFHFRCVFVKDLQDGEKSEVDG